MTGRASERNRRLEQDSDIDVLGVGFPAQMVDDEPEEAGAEVKIAGRDF